MSLLRGAVTVRENFKPSAILGFQNACMKPSEDKRLARPTSAVAVRFISETEMPCVATIYRRAFLQGEMNFMPPELLSKYFAWQTRNARDFIALGAWFENKLVGFCIGATTYVNRHDFCRQHSHEISQYANHSPTSVTIRFGKRLYRAIGRIWRRGLKIKQQDSSPMCLTPSTSYHLIWVAVEPEFAGRGIGRRLLTAMEAQVAEKGFESIYLWVDLDNTCAIRLYKSLGWEATQTVRHKLKMEKMLATAPG